MDQRYQETIDNGGWLSLGRGGTTLHVSPNTQVQGLGKESIAASLEAGIPAYDLNGPEIDGNALVNWIMNGPMPGFGNERRITKDQLEGFPGSSMIESFGMEKVATETSLNHMPRDQWLRELRDRVKGVIFHNCEAIFAE